VAQRVPAGSADGDRAAVELERDLYQLADIGLVVNDEHLGNAVTFCHGISLSHYQAGAPMLL